jgi:hypothetical protein
MSHDMMPLMYHIVRAARLLEVRRDPDDRHNSSSSTTRSSSTPLIDEGGCDHPCPYPPPPSVKFLLLLLGYFQTTLAFNAFPKQQHKEDQ